MISARLVRPIGLNRSGLTPRVIPVCAAQRTGSVYQMLVGTSRNGLWGTPVMSGSASRYSHDTNSARVTERVGPKVAFDALVTPSVAAQFTGVEYHCPPGMSANPS